MASASRGLAPREGLELLLRKMGRTRPLVEARFGPQAGKSGHPRSQNADKLVLTVARLWMLIVVTILAPGALWRHRERGGESPPPSSSSFASP